jgi:hypothetical protein
VHRALNHPKDHQFLPKALGLTAGDGSDVRLRPTRGRRPQIAVLGFAFNKEIRARPICSGASSEQRVERWSNDQMPKRKHHPRVIDIVVYRTGAQGDQYRWLVTRGDAQLFEFDNQHRALAYACSVALIRKVRCFLSDEDGLHSIECYRASAATE